MATSSQKERGRESTEEKPQIADKDVQQLTGCQEDHPTQPQDVSSNWKQEDLQPPHVKEEEEKLNIKQEGHLTKLALTVVTVKTEDHEDKPRWLCPSDAQQLIGHQEECAPLSQGGSSTLKQEDPQPPHVKEEDEDHWSIQEGERLHVHKDDDLTKSAFTGVSAAIKDEDERLAENLLAPLSDSEQSPDDDDTQEPLSNNTGCEGDKTMPKNPYCCSVCGKNCKKKSAVEAHMRTHTGEKPFSCSVCDKKFSRRGYMVTHMKMHTGEKPFSCTVCDKKFSRRGFMVSHMRRHTGEKPFCCSVCSNSFSHKSTLVQHLRTHTGEKPFSCSVCDKTFSQRGHMVLHMRVHTGEKPFSCSVCGKKFSQRVVMESHMRRHTGEKPFVCSVCGKSFSNRNSLRYHMPKHIGKKPFSCSVCAKGFSVRERVVAHMKTHTGEDPLCCSVCSQSFSNRSSLTNHMLEHTGEKPFGFSLCA